MLFEPMYIVDAWEYDSFTKSYKRVFIECPNQRALDKLMKSKMYIFIEVKRV